MKNISYEVVIQCFGNRTQVGLTLMALVPDILLHCSASAHFKPFANIQPHKKNSSRMQVDTHHDETLQISNTRPCGDRCVCKRFIQGGSFNTRGHTECSDACNEECCVWKTYHLYMFIESGVGQRILKWMERDILPPKNCRVLLLHGILEFVHSCVWERNPVFVFVPWVCDVLIEWGLKWPVFTHISSDHRREYCQHFLALWPQVHCKGGLCRGMGNELLRS